MGDALGWNILLLQEISEIRQTNRQNLINSIFVAVGVAVLFVLIGAYLSVSISRPIRFITEAIERLAVGDFILSMEDRNEKQKADIRSMAQRRDEIGNSSRAIGHLIGYLSEMAQKADKIANNDLTIEIEPKSDNDALGKAFQQMAVNLRLVIQGVVSNADGVTHAAADLAEIANQSENATSQIAVTIQQVASGASRQTESINSTAAAVEQLNQAIEGVAQGAGEQAMAIQKASVITTEMNTTIDEVIKNIQMAASGAGEATRLSREGAERVDETISGMQTIRDKVGQVGESVQEMGRRSQQIGNIVETIEDIASQTNLLALNAAIEAARAGEHGKGFAVVADEVGKLAERSSLATKEIAALISGIQQTVQEAVAAMQSSGAEVESGVEKAGTAGSALAHILKSSEQVYEQSGRAAKAAETLMVASNDLVAAVDFGFQRDRREYRCKRGNVCQRQRCDRSH